MPRFNVRQEPDGFWRFQLLTATGAVLLEGNPYCLKKVVKKRFSPSNKIRQVVCFFLVCFFLSPTLKGGKMLRQAQQDS
jgi:hypothetical protein